MRGEGGATQVRDARTALGFILVTVDNRGTPGRGKAFESAAYLNLGVIDAQGQVVVRGAWRCETEPVLIDGKGKIVWPQDGKTKCE